MGLVRNEVGRKLEHLLNVFLNNGVGAVGCDGTVADFGNFILRFVLKENMPQSWSEYFFPALLRNEASRETDVYSLLAYLEGENTRISRVLQLGFDSLP